MTKTNQDIPRDADERYVAGDKAVLTDTIEKDDGSSKDISGADVAFALADYPGADPYINKTDSSSDVTITDAQNGVVEITLDSSETIDLGESDGFDYYYEIVVRDGSGSRATVTTGTWTIYDDTASF